MTRITPAATTPTFGGPSREKPSLLRGIDDFLGPAENYRAQLNHFLMPPLKQAEKPVFPQEIVARTLRMLIDAATTQQGFNQAQDRFNQQVANALGINYSA